MSRFIVEGGHRLHGSITPCGAKNEALQVLCAVLLTREPVTISNLPDILDVNNLIQLLREMGVSVTPVEKGAYAFCADSLDEEYLRSDAFRQRCNRLRGSVMLIGPLLARLHEITYAKPGGDKIGRRRLDNHYQGMLNLGAHFEYDKQLLAYTFSAPRGLQGTYMLLDEASVTATENAVMAAALSEGKTVLQTAQCL